MLEELTISNIVLVDNLVLHFSPGFNCLTGETGAGKSILAGALGLIRGAKGGSELIRTGADEAHVSAVFQIQDAPMLEAWLADHGLALDDQRLVIRRVLRRSGKNGIYIQGQAMTIKDLGECASHVLDLHGQHEHQNLFDTDRQREILDRYAGLQKAAGELYQEFGQLAVLIRQREKLLENQRDQLRQIEYLRYAIDEIAKAKPQPGEDEALLKERNLMQHAGKVYEALALCREHLSASSDGALSHLYSARHELQGISEIDPVLGDLFGRLDSLYYELEDIADNLGRCNDRFAYEPGRLDEIEDRLALLQHLKKKYGPGLPEVVAYLEQSRSELELLENAGQNLGSLETRIKEAEGRVLGMANRLSAERKSAAARLESEAGQILASLGMKQARFFIDFKQRLAPAGTPVCGAWGIDEIEFMLGANPGEPAKPLRNIASGGELSRIMLAIKSAVAETEGIATLVFDEVDTGIGGEVALAVGEHLHLLSRHTQILAITHLASIAVRADNHLRVEKRVQDSRTMTQVELIEGQARVGEIARMLAGDREGDASLAHARELLARNHPAYRHIQGVEHGQSQR